jgi:hypothetical protein
MNRILFTTILSVSFIVCQAQTKEQSLTDAEQFSLRSGILLEKQFHDVGSVKGIQLKVLKFIDINSGKGDNALRIETSVKSSYSTSTKATSLDSEEIGDLVKAIGNLKANILPTTRSTYTEVTFKSKTGFEAGAYFSTEKSKWMGYVQIEKFDRDSMVFFNVEDFDQLLMLLEKAQGMM